MARYIGPVCRQCRREGMKLFLKGERCQTEKCAVEKRAYPPGQHGNSRKPKKVLGYGLQLREKQRAKRYYGVAEKQFRNLFERAAVQKGVTGELMINTLERRLDNVAYRAGFGVSRRQARQIVRHGHIRVNGRRVDIPSFLVQPGDMVELRKSSHTSTGLMAALETTAQIPSPAWLEVNRESLTARVVSNPVRSDLVQIQLNEQLIVELYSR